jgi:hypothetical protein
MKTNNVLFLFPLITLLTNSRRLFTTIKNYNKPVCANCKFYKSESYDNYYSASSKCVKFGEKNLKSGNINYDFSELCRNDITKCGEDGKEFEKENNLLFKKTMHHFIRFYFIYFVYILSLIIFYNKIENK